MFLGANVVAQGCQYPNMIADLNLEYSASKPAPSWIPPTHIRDSDGLPGSSLVLPRTL